MITIVLATYNGEKYIIEQLQSILNQTYKNFTILIIDDNSNDDTIKVVEGFFKENEFKSYSIFINPINLGPTKSFEAGVKLVKTKYIAFCDQDDIWFENKLEYYLNEIKNYDLVYASSYILKNNIVEKNIFPNNTKYNTIFGELAHNNARGATIMLTTDLATKLIPYFDLYDKWILINSKFIANIKEIDIPLHYYRIHTENVNGGSFRKRDIKSLIEVQTYNVYFYTQMLNFFKNTELNKKYNKKDVFHSIEKLIRIFNFTIVSLKSKNKLKSFYYYITNIAFVELTLTEKAIYLYYYLFKYN